MPFFQDIKGHAPIVLMMLFAYAVAIAGFACFPMPIFGFAAMALDLIALLLIFGGLWKLACPKTRNDYLFIALNYLAIVALFTILYTIGSEMAAFATTEQVNGVTPELLSRYHGRLLFLTLIYTFISAVFSGAFHLLFRPRKAAVFQMFVLSWAALPILFLLMKLYGPLFKALLGSNLLPVLIGWLLLSAIIGYGAYRVTEGSRSYTAAFSALAFFLPPVGMASFVIFAFLWVLKPSLRGTGGV